MEIKYDQLLANAKTFFCDSLCDYNNQKYRNAVSELWSGILLLFKCKLFSIDPCLIVSDLINCIDIKGKYSINIIKFERNKKTGLSTADIQNIKKIYGQSFQSYNELFKACNILTSQKQELLKQFIYINRESFGLVPPTTEQNLKTVTFDEIIKRLEKLKEPNEIYKKYKTKLKLIQQARNNLEHCVSTLTENELLAMFETTVPFINDYLEEELQENTETLFDNWDDFLNIKSLADSREIQVQQFVESNTSIDDARLGITKTSLCTKCGHTTIDLGNNYLYCKFCGNEDSYNICSECNEIIPDDGFISFYEDIGICSNCFSNKMGEEE